MKRTPVGSTAYLLTFLFSTLLALRAGAGTDAPIRCPVKVVDAKGEPVAGATVERYQGAVRGAFRASLQLEERATTGPDGSVTFNPTNQAVCTLVARKPGLAVGWSLWFPMGDSDAEAVELTLAAPASVSGLVQDAAHKPVADAEVWVCIAYPARRAMDMAWSPISGRLGRQFFSTRTGADGRFRIEGLPAEAKLDLGVSKPGLAPDQPPRSLTRVNPASLPFEAGQTNIELTLKPAASVEGRVVLADSGAPVVGARVSQADQLPDDGSEPSVTGPDGAFRLEGLSTGAYRLQAVVGTNQPSELVGEPVDVTVEAGVTKSGVKLTVSPGALLEVTVRDEASQKALPGAMVYVYAGLVTSHSATASDQGIARLRLLPGDYQVMASKEAASSSQPLQVSLEANKTNAETILLEVKAPRKVIGAVYDPEGKPAANATVTPFPYRGSGKRTDAQGRFTIPSSSIRGGGINNQPVLVARDLKRDLAGVTDLEEDATNLVIKLEPGLTLAGRITDMDNKPLANAEVELMFWTERMGSTFGQPVHADAEGRFEIKALPPGRRYGVTALAKGYGTESQTLQPSDTGTRRVDLEAMQLPVANMRVAGVVVDSNNKPVPNVMVSAYGEKQPRLTGQTDVKGRFNFDRVCAGSINLSANDSRGSFGSLRAEGGDTNVTVQLGARESVRRIIRTADSGGSQDKVSGTVLDPEGKPSPGVTVGLFPYMSFAQKRTDTDGRFTISADAGPVRRSSAQRVLIARDIVRNLAAVQDLEEDATNATLRLRPGLTLAGRVTGTNGQAIPNAQAQIMFRTERISTQLGQSVRADAEGRFEIKALPFARRYTVSVSARGFGQDQHDVDAPESGTARLELDPFQLIVADQRIAGVVLDADDKPVSGAYVNVQSEGQTFQSVQSNSQGRFSMDKLCPGTIRLSANSPRGGFGSASVEAGDTNVTIRLRSSTALRSSRSEAASLKGKSLPNLAAFGLTADNAPADRPVLVALIDAEQRPSRRIARSLAEQAAALKEKGISVVVLQAGAMADADFTAWKQEAALPFPVGRAKDDAEKTRSAWGASALPWLVLADKAHRIASDGFAVEELEAKIKDLK